jgi:hypothetical protein
MSEHPELSRLPTDDVYWERLASRILADLESDTGSIDQDAAWWTPLAARAFPLAAAALAAGVTLALLLPSLPRSSQPALGLLSPPTADATLIAPLLDDAPPAIGVFVLPRNQGNPR